MDDPLYQILCENNLAVDQVIVALTSRDICSVADFLERGEDSLKDMHAKWLECSLSEDDFKFFKLVPPIQRRKLTNILETLREAKQQKTESKRQKTAHEGRRMSEELHEILGFYDLESEEKWLREKGVLGVEDFVRLNENDIKDRGTQFKCMFVRMKVSISHK
jgi:hypothetical protein